MVFSLKEVVPWGRNFDEYVAMFNFTSDDLNGKIASFGDGPASFNYEATLKGYDITSFDIIYQFSKDELKHQINRSRNLVMKQMRENTDIYLWNKFSNPDEVEITRMNSMKTFLEDYEKGLEESRYIYHKLPDTLPYGEDYFDIGISSHFLLMYTDLGYEFTIKSINEILRVSKEVRIFPLLDINSDESEMIQDVIDYYDKNYNTEIVKSSYEFQKGADKMLVIKK